tara:strand:+ start:276 stop:686 length:411 start_codon:yes stop_codon:yes gene_type:complete
MFAITLIIFFTLIIFIKNNTLNSDLDLIVNQDSKFDILKPKFTINNEKNIISVTANQGNIMDNNDILLKNDVLFKSKDFKIYSDDVVYNREKQTAKSKNDSIFVSEKTTIKSEGFNIIEKGKIIKFNGKSKLILSQ